MVKTDWKTNDKEGRGLRRAFDKLLRKLRDTNDVHELAEISRALAYVSTSKKALTDSEEIKELKAELEEVKKILALKRPEIER